MEDRTNTPSKVCATCGRRFTWRRKWARDWDHVTYCSERCRRSRRSALDAQLEASILRLLALRRPGATICPAEAARAVRPTDWRPLLERTRRAGRRLAADGRIVVMQEGRVVDAGDARGPIRYRASR